MGKAGVKEGQQYASLTDIITKGWSGKTIKQYKGLKKESLRDNMTNIELALNTLAEASATEISKARKPKGFKQSAEVVRKDGEIAGDARKELERQIGRSVVSNEKASDYLPPADRGRNYLKILMYNKSPLIHLTSTLLWCWECEK